jgi:integrase
MPEIEGRVSQANGRLKASKVGARIEIRGDRLTIQATLPPKPGSTKLVPHQQRVSLGVHANPHGVSVAESEARKISALVDCGEFDWGPYLRVTTTKADLIGDWVERFEEHYFQRRQRTDQTETTWKGDYLKVFKNLPTQEPISVEVLNQLILSTAPDTKTRKRTCMALAALAKFAGVELNASGMAGDYSAKSLTPRDIPSDLQIVEWWGKFKNPGWRWVYGMMATYGLRNHEVFRVDFDALRAGNRICEVLKGKTGERLTWPCYPEWFDQFKLADVVIPPINTNRSNEAIGRHLGKYFHTEVGLPFKAYDLRHAWAIRTIEFRLPIELAARQMGHSVTEHSRTYHRWIQPDHHQRAFEALMMASDRPHPPKSETPEM